MFKVVLAQSIPEGATEFPDSLAGAPGCGVFPTLLVPGAI